MALSKPGRRTIFLTTIIIAAPVLLAVTITAFKNKFEKLPVYGEKGLEATGAQTAHTIQPFSLKNQDEKIFTQNDLNNKITVADFFFTSCLSVCPKMTAHLKPVAEAFKNDTDVAIISISVDPETDTPQRLRWYTRQSGIVTGQWNFLTGDKQQIYKLARKSFFLTASDGDGGPNDFIHSDKLVLIDKEKHIRGYYTGTDDKSVGQLLLDIKKLKHEK